MSQNDVWTLSLSKAKHEVSNYILDAFNKFSVNDIKIISIQNVKQFFIQKSYFRRDVFISYISVWPNSVNLTSNYL